MHSGLYPKDMLVKDIPLNTHPLYPGLYGWQVTYLLSDRSVAYCDCFRDAILRYFQYLKDELPVEFLQTHYERIEGAKHLKVAFSRFASGLNPRALNSFYPGSWTQRKGLEALEGRELPSWAGDIQTPKIDETFWGAPKTVLRFQNQICELCIGRVPQHFYCHKMYGGKFKQVYGAWITAELIRNGHVRLHHLPDKTASRKLWQEAENKIRERVGVRKIGEKFISETVLFKTIAYLLPGHEVLHHYRADWLERQELDIFIPSLKLAIEYQGEQHFQAVEAWGGEAALERTRKRDEEKKRRCIKKGVELIYFDHTMDLTEKFVTSRLSKYLNK